MAQFQGKNDTYCFVTWIHVKKVNTTSLTIRWNTNSYNHATVVFLCLGLEVYINE
jgi:hypothetical protein